MYLLFHKRTVLNTSMASLTRPPDPEIPQLSKPKQITGQNTLLCKKCPDGQLNLIKFFWAAPGPDWLVIYKTVSTYVLMSLFHKRTAKPISTKFCTGLQTYSVKVNTTMNPQTQPPDPGVPQTPKPKQIIGQKTLLCKKCPDGRLNLIKFFLGSTRASSCSFQSTSLVFVFELTVTFMWGKHL